MQTWLLLNVPLGQVHIFETIIIAASLQAEQLVADEQAEQGAGHN